MAIDRSRCGRKVRYRSKALAEANITKAWRTGRGKKLPIRSYKCPHCAGWHTTSQAKKNPRPTEDA